jgi:putative radical SAM enzyme (TIGR03279 family)
LTGNYSTLTNLSDEEFEGIIRMRLSPVNVSVHTVNDELRRKMLRNENAGGIVEKIRRLVKGNIVVNAQIVLCKGYNDGEELVRSINVLRGAGAASLSVVPAGLTKFREGLPRLEEFSRDECADVVKTIDRLAKAFFSEGGSRFVYPADEFFIRGELPVPFSVYYDGFPQIENGVGLLAAFIREFNVALSKRRAAGLGIEAHIGTSYAAFPVLKVLMDRFNGKLGSNVSVIRIKNGFFGESATVAGLLTGRDIIARFRGKPIKRLILPRVILRSEGDLTLDGMTVGDIGGALGKEVEICPINGRELINMLVGDR